MTNLPAVQLSTLRSEITAHTERLSPVQDDAILRYLEAMQTAGMTIPQGIDPKNLLPVYRYALTGTPACGLAVTTQKLIKGDYAGNPDILLGMIPKPPVLAAMAKIEARGAREDLVRKRELETTITHKPEEIDRSPEVMARVRAKRTEAVQELRSASAPIAHEPLTAEQAEYWAKIQAIKDAPTGISAEQQAFRRKVAADLEAVSPEKEETHAA
jgi:hypothetical protein